MVVAVVFIVFASMTTGVCEDEEEDEAIEVLFCSWRSW